MGHITNLIVQTKAGDKYLFEAKNILPFFWSILLDNEIIETSRSAWQYYDRLIEQDDEEALEQYIDQLPSPLWLYISKDAFDRNRITATDYLQNYYPEAVSLFTGFCNYIDAQYDSERESDNFIILDIISLAGFYNSASEFMDILLSDTDKRKNDILLNWDTSDLISCGTGFSCAGFDQVSVEYQTIFQKRNTMFGQRPQNSDVRKTDFSWKSLIGWLITLLLCPFFSYLIYIGYLKEGFSFRFILAGICNIGFYIFSIWALIDEVQAFFRSKNRN